MRTASGTQLRNVAPSLGINIPFVQSAAMARLDGNRSMDLVVVTPNRVEIAFARGRGFGPRLIRRLAAGQAVATGRFDAGTSQDILVVQGCTRRPSDGRLVNQPDLVLLGVRPTRLLRSPPLAERSGLRGHGGRGGPRSGRTGRVPDRERSVGLVRPDPGVHHGVAGPLSPGQVR